MRFFFSLFLKYIPLNKYEFTKLKNFPILFEYEWVKKMIPFLTNQLNGEQNNPRRQLKYVCITLCNFVTLLIFIYF